MFGTTQTEMYVFVFIVESIPGIYNDVHYCQFIFFVVLTSPSGEFTGVLLEFH